eukprot:738220-Hanusia_phi.AAC.1
MDSIREAIEVHMEAARNAMNIIVRSTETQLNQRRRLHSFQVGAKFGYPQLTSQSKIRQRLPSFSPTSSAHSRS